MAHIVKQNRPIEKKLIPKAEALELFAKLGQTLKCELIEEKAGDTVQCYTMGEFIDFCLGPHLPSTTQIKAFKLNPSPAAAYWKGKEGNPAMQRIYGYAFFTKEELDQHLHRLEEAKRRDHRKLGTRARPLLHDRRDRARASSCGTRRAASSASRSRTSGATSTSRAATTSSTRRTSRSSSCGTPAGTPSTTRPTCTRPSRSRARRTS